MTTLAHLQTVSRMREFVLSGQPELAESAVRVLKALGEPVFAPASEASPLAKSITEDVVRLAERGRRAGWSKDRIGREALKLVDSELAKARRQQHSIIEKGARTR